MRQILIIGTLIFFMAWPAQAARFSGAYLLELCAMDAQGQELVPGGHVACQSYIAGVIDYHNVLQSMDVGPKVDICIPDNVGSTDLHKIVLKYLEANKQHDGFVAAPAVTLALYEVFPCKKK